jgi:pimeloyl-ACP methyl ester carboxylesterase
MTSAIWSPVMGAFAAEHRTYAVDVMGDVGRTVPTRPPDTERAFADWLAQVYDRLGLASARLLAWSFGGWVGTNFAMHHPERVDRLALLAPFKPFQRQGMGFLYGAVPFVVRTRAAARYFERKMCFREDFGHPEHSEILFERYRSGKLALRVPPRTFTDLEFTLLTMPTLLLIGRQELLFDAKEAVARANHVLPDGYGELVEDCNHAMVSDRTDFIAERVLGFFA